MFVVFQGIESATHRDTLQSICDDFDIKADVRAGISYKTLKSRRLGPNYVHDIAKRWDITLDAGVSLNTPLDEHSATTAAEAYYDFAVHEETLQWVIEFEHPALGEAGRALVLAQRVADTRVLPVTVTTAPLTEMATLLGTYNRLALSGSVLRDRRVPAILRSATGPDTTTLLLGTGQFEAAHRAGISGVSTQAWLSAARYREFIFFDGQEMTRGSSVEREFLLKKHDDQLQALGFSVDLLSKNDAREFTRLAGYSFLKWAESLDGISTQSAPVIPLEPSTEVELPVHTLPSGLKMTRAPRRLPGFGTETVEGMEDTGDGEKILRDRELLLTRDEPVRQCNSCFLKLNCPAFVADASCAYHFPVEVRTPAQVRALLASMLEMQATRIVFARFAEETTGGELDPKVGAEMDRLMRMATGAKKVEERHERLTVSVEHEQSGQPASSGVLSAIFGNRASVLTEDDNVIDADVILSELDDE